ncbi:MAG: RNA chaperone Hfq [Thermoanaerobaculia bacterium]
MMIAKPPINVQDGFFYQLRKDNTPVEITLLSERKFIGRIRRFDKYAVVVDVDGREEMIYKHAISSVASMGAPALQHVAPAAAVSASVVRPAAV